MDIVLWFWTRENVNLFDGIDLTHFHFFGHIMASMTVLEAIMVFFTCAIIAYGTYELYPVSDWMGNNNFKDGKRKVSL